MIRVHVVIQTLSDWSHDPLNTRDLKFWRPKAQNLACEDLWVWKISSMLTWDGQPSEHGAWIICGSCHPRKQRQYRITKPTSPKKGVTTLISTRDILCIDAACHISAISPVKNLDSSISLFIQYFVPPHLVFMQNSFPPLGSHNRVQSDNNTRQALPEVPAILELVRRAHGLPWKLGLGRYPGFSLRIATSPYQRPKHKTGSSQEWLFPSKNPQLLFLLSEHSGYCLVL